MTLGALFVAGMGAALIFLAGHITNTAVNDK